MLFASLQIERDAPSWTYFLAYLMQWFQVAGGVAAIGVLMWGLHFYAEKKHLRVKKLTRTAKVFIVLCVLSAIGYGTFLALLGGQGMVRIDPPPWADPSMAQPRFVYTMEQFLALTAGGVFAVIAVVVPMLVNLVQRLSPRRIGAIARLSIKEAIRQRVIYGFCLVAIVFLFAPYFISHRDADQLRNYVMLIHTALAPLFLVTAAFLGAFSIPADVQRQTIHTIVTKPVEKYEIVLGRFLGNTLLLTVILLVLTCISLIYVVRTVNPVAAQETYKARVPLFADALSFAGTKYQNIGENVGREWTYRSYIRGKTPGSSEPQQFAIWWFAQLPNEIATAKNAVPFEFTFDIFRTTKGKENEGVLCTLTFAAGGYDPLQISAKVKEMNERLPIAQGKLQEKLKKENLDPKTFEARMEQEGQKLKDELCEELGVYQEGGTVVTDYHTQVIQVPAGLFRKVTKEQAKFAAMGQGPQQGVPALKVMVNVNEKAPSALQFIGVARNDLYIVAGELPFWQNFFKMMIGLWCNTVLILGVAIACSTYLSGVISLLAAMFVLGAGTVVEYIRSLAQGMGGDGGGPFESFNRLMYRVPQAAPLEKTAAVQVGTGADEGFRWVLGYVLNLIPDIHRFNLTDYVAEGFNIPWSQLILLDNVLPLVGYLIPWAVLAFYLMNYREIANPT